MSLLTKVEFCDGQEISLDRDSIIVLVGPNNAGKSQSLKDIYDLCMSKRWPGRVVRSIQFDLPLQEVLEKEVASYGTATRQGSYIQYKGLGYSFTDYQLSKLYQDHSEDDSRRHKGFPRLISRYREQAWIGLPSSVYGKEWDKGASDTLHG